MKKNNSCLWGMMAILAAAGTANASYISTFSITSADFAISGFSSGGVATSDPLVTNFSNISGTYNMDIPTSGVWNVIVEMSYTFDFNRDGIIDASFVAPSTDLGNFITPGPSTVFNGSGLLPDMIVPGGPTLSGANLALNVDFDSSTLPSGSFGSSAFADFTLSGGNIFDLNSFFTAMDNLSGGGDGLIDGIATVDATVTLTAVPLPMAALAAFPILAFGGIAARRRKN